MARAGRTSSRPGRAFRKRQRQFVACHRPKHGLMFFFLFFSLSLTRTSERLFRGQCRLPSRRLRSQELQSSREVSHRGDDGQVREQLDGPALPEARMYRVVVDMLLLFFFLGRRDRRRRRRRRRRAPAALLVAVPFVAVGARRRQGPRRMVLLLLLLLVGRSDSRAGVFLGVVHSAVCNLFFLSFFFFRREKEKEKRAEEKKMKGKKINACHKKRGIDSDGGNEEKTRFLSLSVFYRVFLSFILAQSL